MAKTYVDFIRKGTMSTSLTGGTLATNNVFIFKGMNFANNSTVSQKIEVSLFSTEYTVIVPYITPIPAGDVLMLENLHLPMFAGYAMQVRAESTDAVDYYMWGINEYSST